MSVDTAHDRLLFGTHDFHGTDAACGARRKLYPLVISPYQQSEGDEVFSNPLQDGGEFSTVQYGVSPSIDPSVQPAVSFRSSTASSPSTSSCAYSSHGGTMSAASFLTVGTPVTTTFLAESNGMSLQPVIPSTPQQELHTLVPAQGSNNFVTFAPPNTPQTLLVQGPCSGTTVLQHCIFAQQQIPSEMFGGVPYVPLAPLQQPLGTLVRDQVATMSPVYSSPIAFAHPATCPRLPVFAQSPLGGGPPAPSYESQRAPPVRGRAPGRQQRSNANVHGSLQGLCTYHSYNISDTISRYGPTTAGSHGPAVHPLRVFFQMFPCELRPRASAVLNRVLEVVYGDGLAVVDNISWCSDTSFVADVRVEDLWALIAAVHCRVLMDRHGFWYAPDHKRYQCLRIYSQSIRSLPQQERHARTDGLPCMPLVVELSRSETNPPQRPADAPVSFDSVDYVQPSNRRARVTAAVAPTLGDDLRA